MVSTASKTESRPTVSVVIPTYQEVENIEELVERVSQTFEEIDELLEIIVVDDASRDGTAEKIAELQERGRQVRMIERTNERGLSSAVLRGFDEAKGDYLVCMDADLSHPPESLPRLVDALESPETEMVVGSRYIDGGSTDESWGYFRYLNSRIATLLARPFTTIKDPMAGFFGIPRDVYQRTREWDPVGYKVGLEILVKAKCRRVEEVPIHFEDRRRGESKLSFVEQLNYIRHLSRLGRFKYRNTCEALKYAVVGASGALVDLTCLATLLSFGTGLPIARAIAIGIAMTSNFAGNEYWTFRTKGSNTPHRVGILKRYQKYVLSCALGAWVSYLVSVVGSASSTTLATYPLILACVGIIAGSGINFLLAKHWVFTRAESDESVSR